MMRFFTACSASLFIALASGAASEMTTDQEAYDVGETIVFTLQNDSDRAMSWESIGFYPVVARVFGDGREEIVRELPLAYVEALGALLPGEDTSWEWDQRDYHQWYDHLDDLVDRRTQVPDGLYVARFETLEHGEFETETFVIGNPADVDPRGKLATTWAHLKAAHGS